MAKVTDQGIANVLVTLFSYGVEGKSVPMEQAYKNANRNPDNPTDQRWMHKYTGPARKKGLLAPRDVTNKWLPDKSLTLTEKGLEIVNSAKNDIPIQVNVNARPSQATHSDHVSPTVQDVVTPADIFDYIERMNAKGHWSMTFPGGIVIKYKGGDGM